MNYKQEAIQALAGRLKTAGFRVFVSGNGEYGFFTDENGTRVVSFKTDLGNTTFSGNYTTDAPGITGTGWRIADSDTGKYAEMFNAYPPSWAVGQAKWEYTTLEKHLKTYQQSSKYVEA